ncbi:MAG: hypothetical protein EB082_10065, partial [Verrucomicrobia bacterium]|nr:hypothetical protein [Verrucomicrobiota bacterium]
MEVAKLSSTTPSLALTVRLREYAPMPTRKAPEELMPQLVPGLKERKVIQFSPLAGPSGSYSNNKTPEAANQRARSKPTVLVAGAK